jgi:general secretion pathway protein G
MKSGGMKRTRRHGFTLLELLVVMFILVLLAGVVTVVVTKRVEEANITRAKADISQLDNAIELYLRDNNNTPPPTLDALRTRPNGEELPNWNGPYIKKDVPLDPWKRPYVYAVPGQHDNAYDLYTLGRDGKEGGSASDADINNWEN